MRESRMYGSVRGACSNARPYRNRFARNDSLSGIDDFITCGSATPLANLPVVSRAWGSQLCIAWVTAPPVAVRPPSTTYCAPVIAEAWSEHKKSTVLAISSAAT
jgi:hypothetical protein